MGQDVHVLTTTVPLWEIVLRTAAVYIAVLGLLRLGGKRELGQMSPADFVVILIIANAVQNAMNGGDASLTGGIVSAAVDGLRTAKAIVAKYAPLADKA